MSYFRPLSLVRGLAFFTSLTVAANIEVTVGKDSKLEFNPPYIKAAIGDTVTYKFFAKNHAVAQSTFADPCHLQENGIFSGFTPNASPDVAAPTDFTITINDTKPLWFYCPQTNGDHCQKGMVHSINAPDTGNTFDAYKAKALQAATPSTPPADTLPVGGLRKLHIDVGFDGELMFNPNNVTELVGTVVEFSYNPANHSIVQSSFDKPCQPIEREGGGFVAPFVPTQQTPSGVTFEVTLTNPDPIWFYCAQTKKSHCQSGMVGSINAATTGSAKTFQAFQALAAHAPPSTIPPATPAIGALKLNGTFIADANGTILNTTTLDPSLGTEIPPPGTPYPPYISAIAGGAQPTTYNWSTTLSPSATTILRTLQYIDNYLITLLLTGTANLSPRGPWSTTYPPSITTTLTSLTAQALLRRRTYTDALQHFSAPLVAPCADYILPSDVNVNVDAWLEAVQTAQHLLLGASLDALGLLATSDPWTAPALASGLGTLARGAALVDLMLNRGVAAAPREVLVPYGLAASYVARRFVRDVGVCGPPSDGEGKGEGKSSVVIPALVITGKKMQVGSGRVQEVEIQIPDGEGKGLFVAWLGPWGGISYTPVDRVRGVAGVPDSLSGYVWAVLTSREGVSVAELDGVAVAGPEVLWVSQQWSVSEL